MNKIVFFSLFSSLFCMIISVHPKVDNATTLKSKGDVYYYSYRYSDALDCYTQGLNASKHDKNSSTHIALLGSIGNVYAGIGDFRQSVYYYLRGYKESIKDKNVDLQFKFLINLIGTYCMMDDAQNAKNLFNIFVKTHAKNDVTQKQYYYYYAQGNISKIEKKYELANFYYNKTLNYALEKNMDSKYISAIYIDLGNVALSTGHADAAIGQYMKSLNLSKKANDLELLRDTYKNIDSAYSKIGNKKKASEYKNKYLSLCDSVFNQQQFNASNSKLFDYENKQNEDYINNLLFKNRTLSIFIILVFVILILITTFYIILRRKSKHLLEMQKLLVSKNEELIKYDEQREKVLQKYISEEKHNGTDKEHDGSKIMSEEQQIELNNKITAIMSDINIITQEDFNLSKLVNMVDSNTRYVSWIINATYGNNFNALLNEYKIREACKRLSDEEHYGNKTIQAVYEELGYKTAASFIQAFKKVNGMTPSKYIKLKKQNIKDN